MPTSLSSITSENKAYKVFLDSVSLGSFFFFVDNLVRSTTKTLNLNNFLVKIRMYPSNYVKLNYFARFNLFDSLRSI